MTLIPCLHSYCGPCFTQTSKKEKKCPYCDAKVNQVKNDRKLEKVIENCVKIRPELKREDQDEGENIFRGKDLYTFEEENEE